MESAGRNGTSVGHGNNPVHPLLQMSKASGTQKAMSGLSTHAAQMSGGGGTTGQAIGIVVRPYSV